MHTVQYDVDSDKGTTYLGKPKMKRQDELKGIILYLAASKQFISKTFYFNCPSLHYLPKLTSRTKNILVDKG